MISLVYLVMFLMRFSNCPSENNQTDSVNLLLTGYWSVLVTAVLVSRFKNGEQNLDKNVIWQRSRDWVKTDLTDLQ